MIFLDRSRRGPGRFTEAKVALFFLGAVFLLVGMTRERDVLVAVAIAILGVGFLLRFLERRPERDWSEEDEDAGEDGADAGEEPRPPAA